MKVDLYIGKKEIKNLLEETNQAMKDGRVIYGDSQLTIATFLSDILPEAYLENRKRVLVEIPTSIAIRKNDLYVAFFGKEPVIIRIEDSELVKKIKETLGITKINEEDLKKYGVFPDSKIWSYCI